MRDVSPEKIVVLQPQQRAQLESYSRSRALPHALVVRAKIVLLASEGKQNKEIAGMTGTKPANGAQVARAIRQPRAGGTIRRAALRAAAEHRGRADCPVGQQDTGQHSRRGDPLELSRDVQSNRDLEVHRAAGVSGLRASAPPAGELQVRPRTRFSSRSCGISWDCT